MASKLKEIAVSTNSRLLDPDTLYIDYSNMTSIKNSIGKDMDSIRSVFEDIAKKTKSAVSKQAVYDSEEKTLKKIAKAASTRVTICQKRKTEFYRTLTKQTDDYRVQLLESRVGELEAIISKLTAASGK